jgi:carboxyl-terminal processing protease
MHKRFCIFLSLLNLFLFFILTSSISKASKKNNKDETYKHLSLLPEALSVIESEYPEKIEPKELIYGALKGMLASLDSHSQFLDQDAYNELRQEAKGKFGGIGIEITIKDGLLTVITPIEDTPAWRAGIKPLDRIVKINNEITRGMALSDAVKRIRGKPGEVVRFTILREPEKRLLEFKIIRGVIQIKDIKETLILEDKIGYIRISQFAEDTIKNLNTAINNLLKEDIKALILDLRNNPGGLLESALSVAGKFLPEGKLIVCIKGKKEKQNLTFFSKDKNPLLNIPMVVLINGGSASGSEILASALKSHKRAIIIGTKSFGKGSVQSVIPLSDGSALKLTTSKYFTPEDKEISGKGVTPDILVEKETLEPKNADTLSLEEVFDTIEDKFRQKKARVSIYKEDNQILRALDLLRAIKIYEGSRN